MKTSSRTEADVTSRRVSGIVETEVRGRVTGETLKQMIAGYESLGAGPVWSIRAGEVSSYTADAMQEAITGFARLFRQTELRRIVALLGSPTVRMGASVVAMSLRATGSAVEIRIVADDEEARTAIAAPLARSA